jgi:hypothetical protein
MILLSIVVLLSLLALLLLWRFARGEGVIVSEPGDLAGRTRPVDIDAFRNLMDPGEEEFLRVNLLPGEFRAVQRDRLLAARDYVRNTAYNAAILLRLGEAAARTTDPRIVSAGQQLIDSALRLRFYALLAMARLYFGVALPSVPLSVGGLLDRYQHLSGLATQLAVMEHPARGARLSAIL